MSGGPHPLRNLHALREKVDQHSARVSAVYADQLACRAGCDRCCQTERTVSDVEHAALAEAVAALPPLTRARLGEQTTAGCSLLLDGQCSVYADRPLICRSHGLPLMMEGRRDACPLNFKGAPLAALPQQDVLSVEALTTVLVAVNKLYCEEQGGDPLLRRAVGGLVGRGDRA
ncbi:YkgJ family cysteine cluster protein [Myxococcota bacterium]|nr:YkgJ family cysteine cluster protein [Myxococcota bacterium]